MGPKWKRTERGAAGPAIVWIVLIMAAVVLLVVYYALRPGPEQVEGVEGAANAPEGGGPLVEETVEDPRPRVEDFEPPEGGPGEDALGLPEGEDDALPVAEGEPEEEIEAELGGASQAADPGIAGEGIADGLEGPAAAGEGAAEVAELQEADPLLQLVSAVEQLRAEVLNGAELDLVRLRIGELRADLAQVISQLPDERAEPLLLAENELEELAAQLPTDEYDADELAEQLLAIAALLEEAVAAG